MLEEVARLGVRLLMQTAVEAEVTEFLGRERYSHGVTRTNALESLVIAGFVRGLSVRDVEAALGEALGREAALSKSTVSRVCEAIKVEFDAWKHRPLGDVALEYLYLDGSNFKMHDGSRAEPVLASAGPTRPSPPSRSKRSASSKKAP